MKTISIFILLMSLAAIAGFAQTQFPIEPGVSQTLAKWRAANYSDVRYKLSIALEKGAPLMKGELEVRVVLTEEGAGSNLVLDWRTTQFANDKDKPYAYVTTVNGSPNDVIHTKSNEHLVIHRSYLKKGENVVTITFGSPIKTSGAAVTRYVDREDGAEYIYSLFVPSDASTAFPVFDQPDLKAKFQLTVFAPVNWNVVSNTLVAKKVRMSAMSAPTYVFGETKPISTYVFAFAAGDFAEMSVPSAVADGLTQPTQNTKTNSDANLQPPATAGGTDLATKIYVRKSQAEKFKAHEKEIFRLNREAVKYLESYFDFKFPFPKYDLVLIPEFPFGGMEHAGATFLRESSIIFPSEPTANDHISRANLIFHEAAHQWFGDTVTMKWFDDLWLKEGFAEFMAYKTLEKVMPEYNAWKAFYERNKPLAYATDSTKGTTPIYQEIPNLSAAKSAYGNIVYRKAPSFLRQAEFYLGENKFQTAVRAFLKKHQFANAEWKDLVKEFETASGQNLKDWANVWVKKRGMPVFKIELRDGENSNTDGRYSWGAATINIKQTDILGENGVWKTKFKVLYKVDGASFVKEVEFKKDKFILHVSEGIPPSATGVTMTAPTFVFPNYQDFGYGVFLLDRKSRLFVMDNIKREKDDFLRSMMWGALWDSVREAEMNPKDYVELAIKNISFEKDELTIQTILSRVATAMNYYLSDAQAKELAPKLEDLLIDKMQNAPTLGQRITFYRAFLNIASSEKARAVLKRVLTGEFRIEGFNCRGDSCGRPMSEAKDGSASRTILKTKDKFDIVTKLAILGDADTTKLLADLQQKETSDDAKRYAYAVGAGFGTKDAKEKFFSDFVNNKEISESWIESAFVPFNSVRHAELTLPFLERALAELPNLKRNRKIFFVNGWLAAFIGGQKDEKALAIVNKFLADNPNLDKDLRLKILENLDVIERSVKIRGKFGKN